MCTHVNAPAYTLSKIHPHPQSLHLQINRNMIVLESADKDKFEVDESVALHSGTLKRFIEDKSELSEVTKIPVSCITSEILAKVIEYCKHHVNSASNGGERVIDEDLRTFDADFVKVNNDTLLELIQAAHYLNIKDLLHLTCQKMAARMDGYSLDKIRKVFNIEKDITREEENQIRKQDAWAYDYQI